MTHPEEKTYLRSHAEGPGDYDKDCRPFSDLSHLKIIARLTVFKLESFHDNDFRVQALQQKEKRQKHFY